MIEDSKLQQEHISTINDEKCRTTSASKFIKLLTSINLFTSSILCFVYLIVIIVIITFFLPLCGSIFGTETNQLVSFAQPEIDSIDFILFKIELPKIMKVPDNNYSPNYYFNNNNQNTQLERMFEESKKTCDPSSKKIIAHLNSIDNEVLLKLIVVLLGFVFLFVTTIVMVCLSCKGLLFTDKYSKKLSPMIKTRSQQNSCCYIFIILCLPAIEIITLFLHNKSLRTDLKIISPSLT